MGSCTRRDGEYVFCLRIYGQLIDFSLPPPEALNNKTNMNMLFDAHTVDIEIKI